MDNDDDPVAGPWQCDDEGWWTWRETGANEGDFGRLEFQFAPGARPVDAGRRFVVGGNDSFDIGVDHHHDLELRVLHNVLKIATGLRMDYSPLEVRSSKFAEVLEMADDPMPLLSRLEVELNVVVDNCIWTRMRAGKFSKLKVIQWGYNRYSRHGNSESDIQSLTELIQEGRFPALSGLWISCKKDCSEGTVNSLIFSLKGIGSLRSLGISGHGLQKGQTAFAETVQSGHLDVLEELNLAYTEMSPEYYGEILSRGNFKNLHNLNVSENAIGDNGMEALAKALADGNFKELRNLDVSGNDIGGSGMEALAMALANGNFKELRDLHVSGNDIGGSGMEALAKALANGNFKELRDLNVGVNYIEGSGMEALAKALATGNFKELRNLDVSWNEIGGSGMEALAKALADGNFKELRNLDVSRNKIGRSGMEALAKALATGNFKELRNLDVNRNKIGGSGMEALAKALADGNFKELRNLDVSRNEIGGSGMEALAKALADGNFKELRNLDVSGNDIWEGGMEALAKALANGNFKELRDLDVSDNDIEGSGMEALAKALATGNFKELRNLDVSGNDIGGSGMEALAKAFVDGELKKLHKVHLSDNDIGGLGMEALANAFAFGSFQSTKVFDVLGNNIGLKDAEILANAFREGSFQCLKSLNIGNNNVGNKGAKVLLNALVDGKFQYLEFVNMVDNGITMIEFPDGDLPSVRALSLQKNPLGDEGLQALACTLASGRLDKVGDFYLKDSRNTEKGAEALVSAFANNPKLVVNVDCEWYKYPELDRRRNHLLQRNIENVRILRSLEGEPQSATLSKIFLCGYQEVGKTTLLKSLQRSAWKAMLTWERRSRKEARTRGIQTSRLLCRGSKPGEESMTMVVWDLAGQEEYHLIHNAFFSGLTFAEGSATTFVIVCHEWEDEQNLTTWLRFIASSCVTPIGGYNQRHVLIVLNCKDGCRTPGRGEYWKAVLQDQKTKFLKYLEIQETPYIIDARRRKCVQELKTDLVGWSRDMLQNRWVPNICASIQSNLNLWSDMRKNNHKQFPVMRWTEFVQEMQKERLWSAQTIEAAIKYLNEAGTVIFINQKFLDGWDIPECKLVILDPNLLCNQVLGDMFLVEGMTSNSTNLFRRKVNELGSISVGEFEAFFQKRMGTQLNYKDLVSIVMALGLCYSGQKQSLIFPALIKEDRTKTDCWDDRKPGNGYEKGQWVIGFSVEPKQDDISLAPMALWNRFQVELAQSREYNGLPQNRFVVSRTFVAFTFEDMIVLIQAKQGSKGGSPTFDSIDFLVKPRLVESLDKVGGNGRAIQQVDLASILVEMLLTLGDRICPGVKFVQRVVWPWPAAYSWCKLDSAERKRRNVELTKVREWVKEHGPGMSMQGWTVGDDDIAAGQLLSSKDTEYLVKTVQETNRLLQKIVIDAETEGIFPVDGVLSTKENGSGKSIMYSIREITEDRMGSSSTSSELLRMEGRIHEHIDRVHGSLKVRLNNIYSVALQIRDKLTEARTIQSKILQQIQDVGRIFSEDRECKWPRFMYLGEEKSGAWISLQKAVSARRKVHVHFCCEARYDDYRPHPVEDQAGVDISEMKDWAKAAAPWLKVSLTVLFIAAKVAANVIAPGAGMAIPGFQEWQQTSTLAEGVALGTGYAKEELDTMIREDSGAELGGNKDQPRELYGKSRRAMAEFFNRLPYEEYQRKLGLQRVRLSDKKGRFHNIAWICSECYENHRRAGCLFDL